LDAHAQPRNFGEADGAVRGRDDRVGEIRPDLRRGDIEGGGELDVADVITAEPDVHEAGNALAVGDGAVELDALHKRGRAIADPDNRDANLVAAPHALTSLALASPSGR